MQVLTGGETVLGDFRVEYTPGHASHHVSFLHTPTGTALVGDVAGVRIPPDGYVVAPTPPPDIDVEAWERSLDLVAGWEPSSLALTHYGRVDDVAPHIALSASGCTSGSRSPRSTARRRSWPASTRARPAQRAGARGPVRAGRAARAPLPRRAPLPGQARRA